MCITEVRQTKRCGRVDVAHTRGRDERKREDAPPRAVEEV